MTVEKHPPTDRRVISKIAREHGPKIVEQMVKALVAGAIVQEEAAAEQKPIKPSLGKRIASAALVRVATKSVPGAIIVTGGLIAKALHDRHKARQAPSKLRRSRP